MEASVKLPAQCGISNAYCGKISGVVNLPSGDNATFPLVAALMAGVAISDRAFGSTASAIH